MLRDGARKRDAKPENVTEDSAVGMGAKKSIGIFDLLECRTGCRRINGMDDGGFPRWREGESRIVVQ